MSLFVWWRLVFFFCFFFCCSLLPNLHAHGAPFLPVEGEGKRFTPPETVPEIIRGFGYPVEEHNITTSDGYILTTHRIPASPMNPKKVVILQHGLLDSSCTWVMNFPNQSFAFLLADAGYDVWLTNSRGNTYGLNHVSLSNQDIAFWEFSFDQMATYDVPANIRYVLNVTNAETITYVGHSQGTMTIFALFGNATNPNSPGFDLVNKINLFVALAPVAFLGNLTAPFLHQMAAEPELEIILELGVKGTFEDSGFITSKLPIICSHIPKDCDDLICFAVGCENTTNYNVSRVPFYLHEWPAGTSVQNLLHYAQAVSSNLFQQFRYMTIEQNEKHYHQPTPPQYSVENFNLPTIVYHGGNDKLAVPIDVEMLLSKLGTAPEAVDFIPHFGHADFVWGLDAAKLIYLPVINRLASLENSSGV